MLVGGREQLPRKSGCQGLRMQVVKKLACGDTGTGAMAHVDDIVTTVREELAGIPA